MGSPANIAIAQRSRFEVDEPDSYVYLYVHNGGDDLMFNLRRALAPKVNWDDEAYLARMIFAEMTCADYDGRTGFGISTFILDNEYPIIWVDCKHKTVRVGEDTKTFAAIVDEHPDDTLRWWLAHPSDDLGTLPVATIGTAIDGA